MDEHTWLLDAEHASVVVARAERALILAYIDNPRSLDADAASGWPRLVDWCEARGVSSDVLVAVRCWHGECRPPSWPDDGREMERWGFATASGGNLRGALLRVAGRRVVRLGQGDPERVRDLTRRFLAGGMGIVEREPLRVAIYRAVLVAQGEDLVGLGTRYSASALQAATAIGPDAAEVCRSTSRVLGATELKQRTLCNPRSRRVSGR